MKNKKRRKEISKVAKNITIEECNGCCTLPVCKDILISVDFKIPLCPCLSCIIKPMCDTVCDLYRIYVIPMKEAAYDNNAVAELSKG
jgi:hypothetical protein